MSSTSVLTWVPSTADNFQVRGCRGELVVTGLSFSQLVARLLTLTNSQPFIGFDSKRTLLFLGTYSGMPFALYDYKGNEKMAIDGDEEFPVEEFQAQLVALLASTPETSFRKVNYVYAAPHRLPGSTSVEWRVPPISAL